MTVGSSLALFAPFYLIARSRDRHLDRVAVETAQQVRDGRAEAADAPAALTGQVGALRADVDRCLADTAARVAATMEAEAAQARWRAVNAPPQRPRPCRSTLRQGRPGRTISQEAISKSCDTPIHGSWLLLTARSSLG